MLVVKLRHPVAYQSILYSSIYQQEGFSFVLPAVVELLAKAICYKQPADYMVGEITALIKVHNLYPDLPDGQSDIAIRPFFNWCLGIYMELTHEVGALEMCAASGRIKITKLDISGGIIYFETPTVPGPNGPLLVP